MWFVFAIITLLAWGTADLFYKMGSDPKDKYSHLKISIFVGLIMGLNATWMLVGETMKNYPGVSGFSFIGKMFGPDLLHDMYIYLPVSAMYILSMVAGYFGLRYMEVSISSPISNSSGALVSIMAFFFLGQTMTWQQVMAVVVISVGLFMLSYYEKKEADLDRELHHDKIDRKYQIGAIAILFPIIYMILDAIGTFLDGFYLDESHPILSETSANIAYQYTFLLVGFVIWLYLRFVKKEKFKLWDNRVKGCAAIFETLGQFFYVYAMANNAIITAPLIASYSIVSIILSRIFLKEKLTGKQYGMVALIMVGIAILGFFDA